MNRNFKIIIGIALTALVIAGAYYAYQSLSQKFGDELVPSPTVTGASAEDDKVEAIDFSVTDADGNAVKLSDFYGKPIVLNFWASWCSPCKSELPDFEKVYLEMKDDVVFVMVNMTDGQRETVKSASDYISGQGYTLPVYYDTDQEAAYAYGIQSIPTTLFIDGEGYIIAGQQGMLSETLLRKGISLIRP